MIVYGCTPYNNTDSIATIIQRHKDSGYYGRIYVVIVLLLYFLGLIIIYIQHWRKYSASMGFCDALSDCIASLCQQIKSDNNRMAADSGKRISPLVVVTPAETSL